MDQLTIQLATGLGIHNAIGWFPAVLFGVTNVVVTLLNLWLYADKSTEFNNKYATRQRSVHDGYDFIVVGSGSAGSIISNRLSKHFNVLLLESGGQPNPLTSVPGMQGAMLSRAEHDYMYLTVPQNKTCLAMQDRVGIWNAGNVLGGTSVLNGMVYIRGHPYDYDRWAKWTKDERWEYKNLLPYFLRTEALCIDCEPTRGVLPTVNPKYHNTQGELPIRPLSLTPLGSEFIDAMKVDGVPKGDIDAPYFDEIVDVNLNWARHGRRVTAYNAFVEPILGVRKSLDVIKYARVTEVVFEPGTNKVVGVKYERFGKLEVARARKEVIISAGTVGSPKILLLSGIGPEDDLKRLKIPVRADLPVGRNLQDHVGSHVGPFLIDEPLSIMAGRDLNERTAQEFLQNGTGPFAITYVRANALLLSSLAPRAWPDVQVHLSSNAIGQTIDQDFVRQYNFKPDIVKQFFDPVKGRDSFSLMVNHARPRARGTIRLRSRDYRDEPLIDPRYYEDPTGIDEQVMLEGIQRVMHIIENAPSFKRIGARLSPIPFPPCKDKSFKSVEYWRCYIRQYTLTLRHYTSSVTMGTPDSRKAVVDSELKVKGVRGLRVIDASVMPFVVTTNTNAATMAIAERGSDFILETHGVHK